MRYLIFISTKNDTCELRSLFQNDVDLLWAYNGLSVVMAYTDVLTHIVRYRTSLFSNEHLSAMLSDLAELPVHTRRALCVIHQELHEEPQILQRDDIVPNGRCSNPRRHMEQIRLILNLMQSIVDIMTEVQSKIADLSPL